MRHPRRYLLVCACGLLATLGCGKSTKTFPVAGVLAVDGKPLADARVVFNPVDSAGRMAFGLTDAQGRFQLTTFNHNDGAMAGKYKITVSVVGPVKEIDSKLAADPNALMAERERGLKNKPPQVHPNYVALSKTPLTWEVPSKEEVKLDLRKDGS